MPEERGSKRVHVVRHNDALHAGVIIVIYCIIWVEKTEKSEGGRKKGVKTSEKVRGEGEERVTVGDTVLGFSPFF